MRHTHPPQARNALATALLLAFALCGCATTRPMMLDAGMSDGTTLEQGSTLARPAVGVASYYAREHEGRRTASGERYDMHAMTAAHPSLPFGTRVRVTNLDNGRRAVVRINDRGPFRRGRIIDVSYAAARELKMIGPGTARVRIDVL
jgi:rare lipoprotein A